MTERDAYFDNLKLVLIVLVVAGHLLLPLELTGVSYKLFYLIYAFHMPCFVFVSGYFSKNIYRDRRFRTDKLFKVLGLYVVYKLLTHLTEGLLVGEITPYVDFFTESGAPWYLLSLALWYLTLPVAAEFNWRGVLAVSTLFSLLSGYERSVSSFLAMDHTIALAPFFYAGYYMSGERLKGWLMGRRRWAARLLGAAAAGFVLACARDELSPFSWIVYGKGYQSLGEELYVWGPLVRLVWYGAAAALSAGLLSLVPQQRTRLSGVGSRTLAVYILHRPVRDLLQYAGVYQAVDPGSKLWIGGVLAFSVALTLLLGNLNLLFKPILSIIHNKQKKLAKN